MSHTIFAIFFLKISIFGSTVQNHKGVDGQHQKRRCSYMKAHRKFTLFLYVRKKENKIKTLFFCSAVQHLKGVDGQHQQDAAATRRHTESSHYFCKSEKHNIFFLSLIFFVL